MVDSNGYSNINAISTVDNAILFAVCVTLVAALITSLWTYFNLNSRVPFSIVMLIVGVIIALTQLDDNVANSEANDVIALAAQLNPFVLVNVFLPILLFHSAVSIKYHVVMKTIYQSLLLGVIGVLISTLLIALLFMYIISPGSMPWLTALIAGSLLSATDPVGTIAVLHDVRAGKRLAAVIEDESLLNDGVAFVLFIALLSGASSPQQLFLIFLQFSVGGVLLGWGIGILVMWLLFLIRNFPLGSTCLILGTVYGTFLLAETLEVSGVLAVVVLGFYIGKHRTVLNKHATAEMMSNALEIVSFVTTSLVFTIAGIIIGDALLKLSMAQPASTTWKFSLLDAVWGYIALIGTRFIMVAILYPALMHLGYGFNWRQYVIVSYGGLRGTVTIFLVLVLQSSTVSTEHVLQITAITFMGILVTTLINGITIGWLLKVLGLQRLSEASRTLLSISVQHLVQTTSVTISSLKTDPFYSGANWAAVEQILPDLHRICQANVFNLQGHPVLELDEPSYMSENHQHMQLTQGLSEDLVNTSAPSDNDGDGNDAEQPPVSLVAMPTLDSEDEHWYRDSPLPGKVRLAPEFALTDELDDENPIPEPEHDNVGVDSKGHDDQTMSTDSLKADMRVKLFRAMRATYYKLGADEQISPHSARMLLEASNTASDRNDVQALWDDIANWIPPPTWLTWRCWNCCSEIQSHYLQQHFAVVTELITSYMEACTKSSLLMNNEFSHGSDTERQALQDILKEVEVTKTQAMDEWSLISALYPEVLQQVQTMHASKRILHYQRTALNRLVTDGLLSHVECDRILDELHQMEDHLPTRLAKLKVNRTPQGVLQNVNIIAMLPAEIQQCVFSSRVLNFEVGDRINSSRLYIVYRGIIGVADQPSRHMWSVGSLPTLPMVLDELIMRHEKTKGKAVAALQGHQLVVSSPVVQVLSIKPDVLQNMLLYNNGIIIPELWKSFGSMVMQLTQMTCLHSPSLGLVLKLCNNATFLSFTDDSIVSTKTSLFLMCGHATYAAAMQKPQSSRENTDAKRPEEDTDIIRSSMGNTQEQYDLQSAFVPTGVPFLDVVLPEQVSTRREAPGFLLPNTYVFSGDAKVLVLRSVEHYTIQEHEKRAHVLLRYIHIPVVYTY